MKVTLAVIADSANISREGKLNIFGIFNRISAINFPAQHPQMQLVVGLEADPTEKSREKEIEIQLVDSDHKKIAGLSAKFKVPEGLPGYPIRINEIIPLTGVVFPKEDDYEFVILINGDPKGHIPFSVRQPVSEQKGHRKK